jgi:hypothetical protein
VQRKKEEELVLKALSYYPKVIELSHKKRSKYFVNKKRMRIFVPSINRKRI